MPTFLNVDGTLEQAYKIGGPGGPQIKEAAGAFAFRDSADSANANIEAAVASVSTSVVFKEATNDLTLVSVDQSAGARTATIPDLASNDVITFVAAAQTLSGKTLTTPTIVNNGTIIDSNGNAYLTFLETGSAVNNVSVTNAATGNAPQITASGTDANIDLIIAAKGNAGVQVGSTDASTSGEVKLLDNNSSNFVSWKAPATVASDISLVVPSSAGSVNDVLGITAVGGGTVTLGFVAQAGGTASTQQTYRAVRAGSSGAGTVTSTFQVPANTIVQQVIVSVTGPFNNTPTLTVGITGQGSLFMGTADNDLTTNGTYSKFVDTSVGGSNTNFTFTIGGTPNAGNCAVTIVFTEQPVT